METRRSRVPISYMCSPSGWATRIFLFGPGLLPDSDFRPESVVPTGEGPTTNGSPAQQGDEGPKPTGSLDFVKEVDMAVLAELQEPEFKRFVEILRADPRPDRGLRTLLTRLGPLDDYAFFDLGESRESLWESDQPIVIRIHTTQDDNLQKAFASLVFYGLYKDMFRRGLQDHITHAVIFDEAHRAAGLKLIPTMAKECRKYGISLVLASQEAKDFNVSLFSAIANYLVMRLTDADAKALVRNVASSQQERVLIDKIKQMERFKALYFCEGRSKPSPVALAS